MNLERLRWGEWIAAICGLDLLLVTFRSWYKVTGGGHVTAWDALEQGRYLLLVTAAAGIFLWIARAAEDTPERFPIGWVTAGLGLVCTVYIAYRLATPPSDNLDPDVGLFLGLASALGVAIGGLLSAREPEQAYVPAAPPGEAAPDDADAAGDAGYAPESSTSTWSPAAPAASTTGWSPAAPAAAVPPATAAGAAEAVEPPLRSGDLVVLTAGGTRFPAGTVAGVVEAFAGGALVEVKAPDGVAERFEVPESAFERAPGGAAPGAPGTGQDWSPAMPAPANEDWGFDDGQGTAAAAGAATGLDEPGAQGEPAPAKVPWWKREIGGGKKKKEAEEVGLAAGGVAAGAAGVAALEAGKNGAGDEKPGFFKRLFGGGSKAEPATETLEAESTPATDVAGVGQAAESDTAVDEPVAETAVDESPAATPVSEEPEAAPEPAAEPSEPTGGAGAAAAAGAGAAAAAAASSDPEPEPEPSAAVPEPAPEPSVEPDAATSEPEVAAIEPTADEPEATPAASEPADPAAQPPSDEVPPASPAGEPGAAAEPAPPAAPEPEPIASDEPEASAPAAPEPESSGADLGAGAAAAGAGAAAAGAASAGSADEPAEEPKPKRRRSSGSRKVPKEALAAAGGDDQPKVGDEVQLKVGGGRFDAGTKGTVVDVFSAGVIVELSDDEGRTERLDLPFEAIGPADK